MNWIHKLLRKPAAQPKAALVPPRLVTPPVDDSGNLRRGLIAAANDEERERAAVALGRALARLSQAPRAEDPSGVWLAAVCEVPDKALALAWSAGLEGDACLAEVAVHGRFSEVRLAAIQRVQAAAVLERVAQLTREKDKRVYRNCADRLKQGRQAEEDARKAVELAAALRGLLQVEPLHLSHLLELEKQCRSLGQEAPAIAECKALLDQAHARLQQESMARRDLQARVVDAQGLLQECSNIESTEAAQRQDWRSRLEALAAAAGGMPGWLFSQPPAKTLDGFLREIEGRLAQLDAEGARVLACEEFLARLAECPPTDPESVMTASAAWVALTKPEHRKVRQDFDLRWHALRSPADSTSVPEHRLPAPARIDLDAVRRLLEQFEQDVDQGRLAEAEKVAKTLAAAMAGNRLDGNMDSSLQRANAQLGKLRSWAEWGTGQARDSLVAAAEQLVKGETSVDDLAQGVRELREKWKQLNSHGGATAKDQWQRFDAALKTAYLPVAAHRAAEAARQAEAREFKLALCAEWESYCAAIVWERADFKLLEDDRQEMLRRWRAAAQAGFRDERMLRKRFDKLQGSIEQRLDSLRAAEVERREQLIVDAEALREVSDLGRAITEVKALQSRWGGEASPLRLARRDEQKLWQRFRAACDEVFARREAQRAQQLAQREEGKLAIRSLLDAFEASLAVADADSIKRALNQFRADWKAAKANAREWAEGQEARARELQQQAQQRIERLRHEKHCTRFELLERKAAIAEGLEAAAAAKVPPDLAGAKAAWDALPRLPGKSESMLAERLARAPGVKAPDLASGREVREALLLDLEIALGLPTPETCIEARRRRQLEHLQSRFGADSTNSPEAESLLLRWYATTATPDASLDRRMAAVKHRLLEQADSNMK